MEITLHIENNSKFVRGKKKVREDVEYSWSRYGDVQKLHQDGDDYILKVSYESKEELDSTVEDLTAEAHSIAAYSHYVVEISVGHKETGKDWY